MVGDISNFYREIKERINGLTPSTFSTDYFTTSDKAEYMGEKAEIPLYFRHYDVKTTSETENEFSGNYAYQSKTISLLVNIYYSQMGATRILGDDTIDFNAFALNDVEDIQGALITPFNLDTGSTARLIRRGAQINTVDKIIVVSIAYDLVCFLVGSQQLPSLYLGPNVATTQDAGNPQYVVALSDKNCNATLTANKAGLTFDAAISLVANQPQIIAIEGDTVDAWTLTLTALGETATCTYQIYAGSAEVNQIVPVVATDSMAIAGSTKFPILFCKNPGTVELTSSDPTIATVTPSVVVPGNRNYRVYNSRYGEATKGNATINAATAGRDQVSICTAYDLKNAEAMMRHLKAFYSPTLAMSMKANGENRMNWCLSIYHFNENQSYFRYRQSVDSATNGVDYATGAIGNGGIFINRHRIKIVWIFDGASVNVYWKYLNTAIAEDTRTITRLLPVGTMGNDVLAMIGCEDFAYYNRKLDANERASYYAGTFPSDPVCAYPMNEETGVKHYDLYGTNDTELGIDQTYGFPLISADNRNFGPNRFAIDTVPVEPWQAFTITPIQAGTVTITAKRRRAGIPDRATDEEKYEIATATVDIAV